MKRIGDILGFIGIAGALATVVLAVFVVGAMISKLGQVPDPVVATAAGDAGAATDASDTAAPAAEAQAQAEAVEVALGAEPAAGSKVFNKCKACNTVEEGGKNGTGPNLWNVVGRPVASVADFGYSDAIAGHAADTWTPEFLDA